MLISVLQSVVRNLQFASKEKIKVVISRLESSTLVIVFSLLVAAAGFGQEVVPPKDQTPPQKEEKKPSATQSAKDAARNPSAEVIAESAIFIYGLGGGRATLNQIRKTAIERGKMSVINAEGKMDQVAYQRWTLRAETLNKEKIRLDQEFPTAKYSLIFNDEKIFGIVDNQVFTPREDASRVFENQIVHGLEVLLRYKENESKLNLIGKEKFLGVEYYLLDVTDKQSRKTRLYVSAKSFRVMMLEYDEAGIKFRRRFYDYNYAQGTLVPYKTILWAGEKLIEETEIGTISFGQKVDDALFAGG